MFHPFHIKKVVTKFEFRNYVFLKMGQNGLGIVIIAKLRIVFKRINRDFDKS